MTRVWKAFVAVAATLILAGPPAWADCKAGFVAFKSADYQEALSHLLPCAQAGYPAAQYIVGVIYDVGQGVLQNDIEAVRWYRRAAEQGVAQAQYSLGESYASGEGVVQDDKEAARWYRLAADQGVAGAQANLGVMYFFGIGVVQNDAEAARRLRSAAEQGNPKAQSHLGAMYSEGRGVPQDDLQAYMWLNLAGAQLPQGERRTATVALRDYIGARLTPAERARGQELARNWRPRVAARAGSESPAYAVPERSEPPRTKSRVEPNPFRAALELQARQNRDVQQFLADLGYDPGPVDGVVGPRTRAAVRAFQADAGLPVDGEISDELYAALSEAVSSGQRVAARSVPTEWRLDSTGTGFAVSRDGHLLTNHHVVADCAEVRVQPHGNEAAAAVIVARDPNNDLALLEASVSLQGLGYLDDRGIRPGDSVVAVGFPLPGLLASEASVTTGTVSALAGIGNDTRLLQVTVPVQPGNSGGPLLDLQGRVVGVVVGKLDALEVASVTGDIPQNVNFAVKAGVVRTFLQASGLLTLDEAYGEEPQELRAAAVGAKAKEFTVLVECWK